MKYNDEQLSAILSAHAGKGLKRGGISGYVDYVGCINQVAFNSDIWFWPGDYGNAMCWFDDYYKHTWTPDRFLQELVKHGWA